jgi:hypothetical protein
VAGGFMPEARMPVLSRHVLKSRHEGSNRCKKDDLG